MTHRFVTADVFTNRRFGGNPLAVFPDARAIPESALLPIAREFNLSETAFVYPPARAASTRRVRIFTPAAELPFAGHPTVGTAFVLAALGEIRLEEPLTRIVLEEGVGDVAVVIRAAGGQPVSAQLTAAAAPEIGPQPPGRSLLADMLSLESADIPGGVHAPQAVSCGLPFLIVPLRSRDAVSRARVRLDHWESGLRSYWAPQILVFSRDGAPGAADLHARVFVPGLSVPEDPATGSAAAALGAYLAARDAASDASLHWSMEQGIEMGRPSRLEIEVDKAAGRVAAVRVGGEVVLVMQGELRADDG